MSIPQLNVYRHDRHNRALLTLAGEIDLNSAALVRESLAGCLSSGIRSIEIDLTTVTFCDCSGLNAFVDAWHRTTAAGGVLQLHYPPPALVRVITLCGAGFLLGPLGLRRLRLPFPGAAPAAGMRAMPAVLEGVL